MAAVAMIMCGCASWRIVDHDHDRLDAFGGTLGGRATATRQLGKLGAQIGVQPIKKPRRGVTTFVRGEAEAVVAADPESSLQGGCDRAT